MSEPRPRDDAQRRLHQRCNSASAAVTSSYPTSLARAEAEEERRLRRSPPVEARRERERRRRAREPQPRCGEVAGGTAAECAAVCCCFPCAVVELVVLAAVRVPAALCRRALRALRRRRRAARAEKARKKEMDDLIAVDASSSSFCSPMARAVKAAAKNKNGDSMDFCHWPPTSAAAAGNKHDDLAEAEKAVWASFQGAGFWRSPSQREEKR
ncbi:hypothetical protein HU200_060972 [Digitaria exilis]|uniref:Uncharacterized protein n=1 Tax=Digitaria exilis TaxID=1010633 RepID=A0A835A9R9_9POAL|nr:hypothetical protein HU200_060972 [Digitaria exilis]